MTDVTVTILDPFAELRLRRLTGAFLTGYRNANTRTSYLHQLHRWFAWCTAHQLDPLVVERTHVELYLRWFERQVGSINTVCHGISVLASFYRWLVQIGLLETTPLPQSRRPSRDETPRQTRLTLRVRVTGSGPFHPGRARAERTRRCSSCREVGPAARSHCATAEREAGLQVYSNAVNSRDEEHRCPTSSIHLTMQQRGVLTLPAGLRKRHHLDDPGAQVRVVEREDGVIELHAELPVPADQVGFWSERWQRMEREADEDIAKGRVARFDDVEYFLADLDA